MELYVMKYVLAVAECRSLSQAAQICHIGQPALSQQITRLEKELGVPLFSRESHGMALTEAGRLFVDRARDIIQRTEALTAEMNEFSGLSKGTLTIGIITSLQCIDFGNLLSGFCAEHPLISVNIVQGGTHELLEALTRSEIDLAFLNKPVGRINSALYFSRLGKDRYSLAVSAGHRLADRTEVSLRELKDERFIFHRQGQVASDLILRACKNAGFYPNIVCRSGSPTTTLYMVQGGLGIALLPQEEFRHRNIEGVKEIALEEKIEKQVGIAFKQTNASPVVRTMLRYARNRVSGQHSD